MTDTMADRRGATRYPVVLSAEVTQLSSGTKFHARTSDISRTGCYIDTLQPISKGLSIRICITNHGETLEIIGTVMYVSVGQGIGVQFEAPLDNERAATLERWLEAVARQPA